MKKEKSIAKTLDEKVDETIQEANVEETKVEENIQEANVEETKVEENVQEANVEETKVEENVQEANVEDSIEENLLNDPQKVVSYIVYNCNKLNVRKKPYKDSKVIHILSAGQEIIVNGVSDTGWARVYLTNGIRGYVMLDYIKEI